MNDFWTNPIVILVLLIALVAISALFMALRAAYKKENGLGERLGDVEKKLTDQMQLTREQAGEEAGRDREALSSNLRGMGDSVTRVMGEMARTQQGQLDAFSGQLRDMGRIDEARMGDMRKVVEERLADYEVRIGRIGQSLDEKLDRDDQRLERIRQTVESQMGKLRESNEMRLEKIEHTVDAKLDKTLDRHLGERFQAVSDRLDRVYRELGEMQTLSDGVGDLKKVLTGVRARGLLGEIQLGGLLSQLMTADQYETGVVIVPGGEAADFAIRLPGRKPDEPTTYLPIDAQCPSEAYCRLLDAQDSGDAELIAQMTDELTQKLRSAAERVARQFIHPPKTTDFAVLFLTSEGLYAEALRQGELVEKMQREDHVMLTGPNTLAALINSLQMGFKTIAIERHSEEVWALLGAVRGELADFAEALARTQKRIRQAGESIEDASRKSRAIERRLKGVEKLDPAQAARLLANDDPADDDTYADGDWD